MPKMPGVPSGLGGSRAEKAAKLKAEMDAKKAEAQAKAAAAKQAAGAEFHHVQSGESLEDIAGRHGQSADAIWNHPLNKQLRDRLGSPDKLGPGDGLYIPKGQATEEEEAGPVGQGDYIVKDGECIASIAKNTGHFWKTIWDDPANSELREVRKQPNVLLKGDRVTIPEIKPKQEPGETEMRHRFKRKGEPSHLKIRAEKQGQPRANEPYKLTIDDQVFEGVTDAEGKLDVPIPGNARRGELEVGTPPDVAKYEIKLGELAPVETWEGVQARLKNLGFECDQTGEKDEQTMAALNAFLHKHGKESVDMLDEENRKLLQEKHGS